MKMIDNPSFTSCRSVAKRSRLSCGASHRGGLVQDQHARAAVERLQDFHALALADGKLGDTRVGC